VDCPWRGHGRTKFTRIDVAALSYPNASQRRVTKFNDAAKGAAVGLIGGSRCDGPHLKFQKLWQHAAEQANKDDEVTEEKEDATMKAAGKVASVAGKPLSHDQKQKLGLLVHYDFGTSMSCSMD